MCLSQGNRMLRDPRKYLFSVGFAHRQGLTSVGEAQIRRLALPACRRCHIRDSSVTAS